MKESWRTINQAINKRSKSTKIDILRESGSYIDDKQDIANTMNVYFCSVGKVLASEIETVSNPLVSRKYNLNPHNKQFISYIWIQSIREAMVRITTSKNFGRNELSSYFLKLAISFVERSLAPIFNTCLETNHFPDSCKNAHVTPICKEGDKAEKSNCCPISILLVISMLLEKIAFNQLYQYLVKIKDDWYIGQDNCQMVDSVFIDRKNVFNNIDHDLLCKNLEHCGIQ